MKLPAQTKENDQCRSRMTDRPTLSCHVRSSRTAAPSQASKRTSSSREEVPTKTIGEETEPRASPPWGRNPSLTHEYLPNFHRFCNSPGLTLSCLAFTKSELSFAHPDRKKPATPKYYVVRCGAARCREQPTSYFVSFTAKIPLRCFRPLSSRCKIIDTLTRVRFSSYRELF